MTQCEPVDAQSNLKEDCGRATIRTGSTTAIIRVIIFFILILLNIKVLPLTFGDSAATQLFNVLQTKLFEEVITLVINEDERREVLNADLPDRLHPKIRILNAFDALDALVGENGGGTAD